MQISNFIHNRKDTLHIDYSKQPVMPLDNIGDRQIRRPQSSTNLLNGINERVNRAEVICRESESIGASTLDELAQQRDTLDRTRGRLADTNVELTDTNRTLKSIHRRIATNKLLLGVIILLELMIIGCQLYLKLVK